MQEQKTVWTILKILQWTQQYFQSKGVENLVSYTHLTLPTILRV